MTRASVLECGCPLPLFPSRAKPSRTARLFSTIFFLTAISVSAGEERWWPIQTLPNAVVETENQNDFPEPRAAFQMMMQSIAGLAAKAVNESKGDEMVWVNNGNVDLDDWYARFLHTHPKVEKHGSLSPWELVNRFASNGIIKGYILYRGDSSSGENNAYRPGMDCSVNVATSLAGLLGGIIVEERLEKAAQAHGLKLLLDVRAKDQTWCFESYKDQFNRRLLCTQDPRKPNVRDLAIAQKVFTAFGSGEPISTAMAWLEPLSPILGWNGGDEFVNTSLSSRYGHIQTATDWCMNLPVLMAGSEKNFSRKLTGPSPKSIDWKDHRSAVSFIGTDGDNVQWFEGNFFRADESKSYWANRQRGKVPYGWSCCFAHLTQLVPQAIDYAQSTGSTNDSFIEWGGGYYFPDQFGSRRANRWELLGQQASRTWELMKKNNTRIIGFNCTQFDSPDALKAYETIAAQSEGLLAILVFQYSAYEAGAGETFWVKDRNGIELPVITARYSLWEHENNRKRSGTPAKVAREIRQTVERNSEVPRYDWVIAHAWSWFKHSPGPDEDSENMPQENAEAHGGSRGYAPVIWCAERLPQNIRVVSPEELIWRIRMKHNARQTVKFMVGFE
jgi:putative glycoside hydrolase with GxGYxYP motif/GxGYxY motif-containing protein